MAAIALIETKQSGQKAGLRPHEETLARVRHESRRHQMLEIANELARKGVRRLAVLGDPESLSAQLAKELNDTGVERDSVTCENDMEILDRVSQGGASIAGLVPLQNAGAEKTIPLGPDGRNVLEVIESRRLLGLKTIEVPQGEDGPNMILGLVQGPRKI
jgi:hypothetical protein